MEMKHILLECYCDCENRIEGLPCYESGSELGIHCFEYKCKYLSYTKCPNEIAYANNEGIVENELDFVGFGGDMDDNDDEKRVMLIEKWHEICREKIDEAYEEYMKYKSDFK